MYRPNKFPFPANWPGKEIKRIFERMLSEGGEYFSTMIKGLPWVRKFKSYTGLKGAEKKLSKWINNFDFVDIKTAVDLIDWHSTPTVHI